MKWWRAWNSYVSQGQKRRVNKPGPIDNTSLLDLQGNLKRGLEEDVSFRVVPKAAWKLLKKWYGGGPAIQRNMIKLNGVYQIEIYPILLTVKKIGELESYPIAPLVYQCSKLTQMKEIFRKISEHYWLPIHNIVVFIPSIHSTSYKQVKYASLSESNFLYVYSAKTEPIFFISCIRADGTFKIPAPIIRTAVSKKSTSDLNNISPNRFGFAVVSDSPRPAVAPGVVGLTNVGNSCYLNSTLQCLFHTPEIREHFIKSNSSQSGMTTEKINPGNGISLSHDLVNSFSHLLNKLWKGNTCQTSAEKIRKVICDISPQFIGFRQHDAHEALVFLLDGLHEALKEEEQPEKQSKSKKSNKTDDARSKETLNSFMENNNSLITQIFFGELKSTMTCSFCKQVQSKVFEPFLFLSVPIPVIDSSIGLTVTLFPTNSPPLCFQLKLQSSQTMLSDLKEQIVNISPIPVVYDNLFLTQVKGGMIKCGHGKDHDIIPLLLSPLHQYFIYEVPKINTKVEMAEEKQEEKVVHRGRSQSISGTALPAIKEGRRLSKIPTISEHIRELNPSFVSVTEPSKTIVRHHNYLETYVPYREIVCQFVCRHFVSRSSKSAVGVSTYGYPLLLRFSRYISHKELLVAVKEKLNICTRLLDSKKVKQHDAFGVCYRLKEFDASIVQNFSPMTSLEKETSCGFSLRYVNQSGSFCGLCDPSENCRGCSLEDISLRSIENGKVIAIDFHTPIEFIPVEMNSLGDESDDVSSHVEDSTESTETTTTKQEGSSETKDSSLTLRKCFKTFLKKETLPKSDTFYCDNCTKYQPGRKQLELWTLPNILIIQLKRFKNVKSVTSKISNFVDFPVTKLNMNDYLGKDRCRDDYVYDLYAVINHTGGGNSGHYTASVKHTSGQWYLFNDAETKLITTKEIVSTNAYLLFYRKSCL